MLRTLKKLVGIWEPKEGVLYTSKDAGYERRLDRIVDIITECFVNGKWQPCSFMLKKGKYHVFLDKKTHFVIEKKYVKVEKKKIDGQGVAQVWLGNHTYRDILFLEIHYRLMVKDPSKIVYIKE
jgi:hypothetical protein